MKYLSYYSLFIHVILLSCNSNMKNNMKSIKLDCPPRETFEELGFWDEEPEEYYKNTWKLIVNGKQLPYN